MSNIILIADSGSTKTEWCLLKDRKSKRFFTQGLSPYFLDGEQISEVLQKEVLVKIKTKPGEIFFYGTGCKTSEKKKVVKKAISTVFGQSEIIVEDDLTGAARALCGKEKGIACILGTGSNSCYYNGNKVAKNSPGIGYILGDEGSGAFLGKSLLQHYLYDLMDEDLKERFETKFATTPGEILDSVYREPLANRYLASFAIFLAENRGHYMVENIIGDGLNTFFFTHLLRYHEVEKYPLHFTGSIAFGFKDVLKNLCEDYQFILGNVLKNPMVGLVKYHQERG